MQGALGALHDGCGPHPDAGHDPADYAPRDAMAFADHSDGAVADVMGRSHSSIPCQRDG